jgi:hypothetical protein
MPNVSSPAALPQYIEQLLNKRQQLTADIATIDSTLERVTMALGGSPAAHATAAVAPKKRGRPFSKPQPTTGALPMIVKAPAPAKAPARASKNGMTANEFVLAFVQAKKNPTSQEINQHWKASGRLGAADNSLSLLTKAKKLKRVPLGSGIRGSRYMVP